MYPQHVNHWIADREVAASTGGSFEKRCPIDDRVIAHVARGMAGDVAWAVDTAAGAA